MYGFLEQLRIQRAHQSVREQALSVHWRQRGHGYQGTRNIGIQQGLRHIVQQLGPGLVWELEGKGRWSEAWALVLQGLVLRGPVVPIGNEVVVEGRPLFLVLCLPGRSLEHFALPLDGAHRIWHQSGGRHEDPGRGYNSGVDTGYYRCSFLPENKRREKTVESNAKMLDEI